MTVDSAFLVDQFPYETTVRQDDGVSRPKLEREKAAVRLRPFREPKNNLSEACTNSCEAPYLKCAPAFGI